jgi:hypothetical protein
VRDLPAWDVVWARVSRCLAEVATKVARKHPAAWSAMGRTQSDAFPFGAAVSFGKAANPSTDVEDVVISVSGHVDGDALRMSADVARGDGYVLADGPTIEVPLREAEQGLERVLESWLSELEVFLLQAAAPCVVRELSATR